jgi:triosephosphate isomerase
MSSGAQQHTRARSLWVGNWKMNGSRAAIAELLGALRSSFAAGADAVDVGVCCPFPYLVDVAEALAGSNIAWGAQDCSAHDSGPYTGEVSAAMLAEFGCRYVIVGHSERRVARSETDALVAEKASRALAHGLTPIVCVGESLAERESGATDAVVKRQLSAVIHRLGACVSQIVVAYEPIWAIGTGHAADPQQAQSVHAVLRAQLHAATERSDRIPLLYGGSVTASIAGELMTQPDIDGGLIGGASLNAAEFLAICRASSHGTA